MRSAGLRLVPDDFAFFIEDVIAHLNGKLVSISVSEDLLNFIFGSLLKAPNHLLLVVLEHEIGYAILELVVAVLLVVVCVDTAVFVEDVDLEIVVSVEVLIFLALDLLLDDQAFERPVLDLHGIGKIVDISTIINLCHVVGQPDEVVKADLSVILRFFYLLNMIYFIEKEVIIFPIEDDLTVFICLKYDFFCMIGVFPKVDILIFSKDLELNT